jgi:putative Mg2+ transporter-C (MgtC) family protein
MDVSIILKLVLAALLGGIVGIERQMRDKPAGLRTNMLICVGATQFMAISTQVAATFGGDPSRIAAQIISGIGFLGAGAVLQSHGFVMGLTTAATIWVVAGIGMAVGAGMYGLSVLVAALTLSTLFFLSLLESRFPGKAELRFSIVVDDLSDGLATVERILRTHDVAAANLSFKKEQTKYRIGFQVQASKDANREILSSLSREAAVSEVETGKPNSDTK